MTFFGVWVAVCVAFIIGIAVGMLVRGALLEEDEDVVRRGFEAARHVARREVFS